MNMQQMIRDMQKLMITGTSEQNAANQVLGDMCQEVKDAVINLARPCPWLVFEHKHFEKITGFVPFDIFDEFEDQC